MHALRCGRGRRRRGNPALVWAFAARCARPRHEVSAPGRSVRRRPAHRRPGAEAMKCTGLALHRRCAKEVQRRGRAVPSPFKACRAVRPAAASGPPGRARKSSGALPCLRLGLRQGHALFGQAVCRAMSLAARARLATIGKCALHSPPPGCGLTRRSSGRSKACCARFSSPLISNVRSLKHRNSCTQGSHSS